MSRRQRLGFASLALVIGALAAFVLARDPGEEGAGGTTAATATAPTATGTREPAEATPRRTPRPTPEAEVIEVRGGRVVGGARDIEVDEGDTVRLVVRSDTADEVHAHGYEVRRPVPAGGRARLVFRADVTGIFEIELEGSHLTLARLRVNP